MNTNRVCELYFGNDQVEARTAAEALRTDGIAARLIEDDVEVSGDFPFRTVRIWVPEKDRDRGRRLLTEHFTERRVHHDQGTQWLCPECGEPNGSAFDLCWNCRAARSG